MTCLNSFSSGRLWEGLLRRTRKVTAMARGTIWPIILHQTPHFVFLFKKSPTFYALLRGSFGRCLIARGWVGNGVQDWIGRQGAPTKIPLPGFHPPTCFLIQSFSLLRKRLRKLRISPWTLENISFLSYVILYYKWHIQTMSASQSAEVDEKFLLGPKDR